MNNKDLLVGTYMESKVENDEKVFASLVTIKCLYNFEELPEFSSHWIELYKKSNGELYYLAHQDIVGSEFNYNRYEKLGLVNKSSSIYLFQSSWGRSLCNYIAKDFEELKKYIPLEYKVNFRTKKIPIYYLSGKKGDILIAPVTII